MYIVDDPTLALIVRFVGGGAESDCSDASFFAQQLAAIEEYLVHFVPEEREQKALEWIATNARKYRQQWQRRMALGTLPAARCPDCPLTGSDSEQNCAIHMRWLGLLRRYTAGQISSHEYVERSLALLYTHKEQLNIVAHATSQADTTGAAYRSA